MVPPMAVSVVVEVVVAIQHVGWKDRVHTVIYTGLIVMVPVGLSQTVEQVDLELYR